MKCHHFDCLSQNYENCHDRYKTEFGNFYGNIHNNEKHFQNGRSALYRKRESNEEELRRKRKYKRKMKEVRYKYKPSMCDVDAQQCKCMLLVSIHVCMWTFSAFCVSLLLFHHSKEMIYSPCFFNLKHPFFFVLKCYVYS